MLKPFCDLCGKEMAASLDRIPLALESGRRILVSIRVEVDEGERDAKKVDVCRACLRTAAKAFVHIG